MYTYGYMHTTKTAAPALGHVDGREASRHLLRCAASGEGVGVTGVERHLVKRYSLEAVGA